MATSPAQIFAEENRFYGRAAIALCSFIFIGFALFDLIAAIDLRALPFVTHLHALAMTSWLALFVSQSLLAPARNLPLHRKLGWAGAVLVLAIVATSWAAGYAVITQGRAVPVFDPGYFFALTLVQPVLFAALVYAGIARRKRTDWHRRLMLGALVVIMEPLLGRLTIMGFIIAQGGPEPAVAYFAPRPWLCPAIEFALQALVVAAIMLRDRKIRGSVHPALWWTAAAVAALYVLTAAIGLSPPFAAMTRGLLGSAA